MSRKLSSVLKKFKLWAHQRRALTVINKYVTAYSQTDTDKSALVQMPTGSGKSGVISIAAHFLPNLGAVLVLTPRVSLRDQLCRDIQGRFFQKIGYPVDSLPKIVQRIDEGHLPVFDSRKEDRVYVTTIQKFVSLARTQEAVFRKLTDDLSLIVVDEGHYEPAKEWSKAIRAVKVPMVVFTATPYRNDFKIFNIDPEHAYVMSHKAGVLDRCLRELEICHRDTILNPMDFVDDVLAFYDSQFPDPGEDPPRVIIRCDDSAEIRHLAQVFLWRGRSVVGIHERFRDQDGETWERRTIPRSDEESATFWIHQFKLLEGIDDPRFQVLALYKQIRNGRALVQQVGRIVRNPLRQKDARAYLLDHWNGHHENLWNGFLSYDQAIHVDGINAFRFSTGESLLKGLLKVQPKTAYLEGRFRSEFDFSAINPLKDVQLPLKSNLLAKLPSFDLDGAVAALNDFYQEKDRITKTYEPSLTTRIVLSVTCSNSRYLRNHVFMESDLHVAVLHEFDECVGFYETSGLVPANWDDAGLGAPVSVKRLRRLFKHGQSSKLTSVSLKNSNLGVSVIRTRSITASSIGTTVPSFDDYAQICTTAEGYTLAGSHEDAFDPIGTEIKIRRYVGFSRGRVSQARSGGVALSDYIRWLTQIDSVLNSNTKPLVVLSRYASETEVPRNPSPRSILLDITDIQDEYYQVGSNRPLQIEDTCCAVNDDGDFKFVANGESLTGRILFDGSRLRYVLQSSDLDTRFFTDNDNLPGGVVQYLNQRQAFRVVPDDWRAIYVNGAFYRPTMRVGRSFDAETFELGHCFLTDATVGAASSEKGRSVRAGGEGWENDSLFGIIDELGAGTTLATHFGRPDILVCDDMGREAADFFLCDTSSVSPRVVLIHAKASAQTRLCSASQLHDVCAQAVKNLGYLAMFSQERPSRIETNGWASPWRDGRIGTVNQRVRRGAGTSNAIWKKIQDTINNPLVQKEVWLFLGQILSREAFENKLSKKIPAAEALQAAYLLHATMTDVAAVGGRLRIVCGP